MDKRKTLRRQILTVIVGMLFLLLLAAVSYSSAEKMLIEREQENLKSLAKVKAENLASSLEAKKSLIYAALAGEMHTQEEVDTALLKLGERGEYIPLEESASRKPWEQEICRKVLTHPGEVLTGPVRAGEGASYVLYMAKAVSLRGSLAGCVIVELELDEFYTGGEEGRDCIVKNAEGMTVMPGGYDQGDIALSHETEAGCTIEWVYETKDGIPRRTRKLIALETAEIGGEKFSLYMTEDYDMVTRPAERIALYFFLLCLLLILFAAAILHQTSVQHKKETLLVKELQHEKTLNEVMKKQEGLMQKYNHSKTMDVLTGSIAHEFNNLMTPIVLYAEMLEENETVLHEMTEEISELKSSALRCGELARQLLDYSRQGRAEKILADYDATYAMQEAVSIIKKIIPEHIRLEEHICKTAYYIHGQAGALNQIVLNLTTNAVHAMKEGGLLRIQFGLSTDDGNYVRLIVEDTGEGIAREIRQKVFQPFFTTMEAGEGTGIGLTVVKRLAEEHGGSIRVKTEPGKGTMFILDFPRTLLE